MRGELQAIAEEPLFLFLPYLFFLLKILLLGKEKSLKGR